MKTPTKLENHCKVAGMTSAFLHASLPSASMYARSLQITLSGGWLFHTGTTSACTGWSSLADQYLRLPLRVDSTVWLVQYPRFDDLPTVDLLGILISTAARRQAKSEQRSVHWLDLNIDNEV